jgi:hypothetical protein
MLFAGRSRLRRPVCGKAPPFRLGVNNSEAMPQVEARGIASLIKKYLIGKAKPFRTSGGIAAAVILAYA